MLLFLLFLWFLCLPLHSDGDGQDAFDLHKLRGQVGGAVSAIGGEPGGEWWGEGSADFIWIDADFDALHQPVEMLPLAHQGFVLLHRRCFDGGPGQLFDVGQPEATRTVLESLQAGLGKGEGGWDGGHGSDCDKVG